MEDDIHEYDDAAYDEEAPETVNTESKTDRFKRLGQARYIKAVQRIRLLGNLSNTAIYEYKGKQVKAMFDLLRAEIDKVEAMFADEDDEIVSPFDGDADE